MKFVAKLVILATLISPLSYSNNNEVCVKSTGNQSQDLLIATAKAKGQLAFALGSHVTASNRLDTVTKESDGDLIETDTLTETVTLKAEHFISGVEVLSKGYQEQNGTKYYCVGLGKHG